MVKFKMYVCPNCGGKGGVCVGLSNHLEPNVAKCPVCLGRGCTTTLSEIDDLPDKESTVYFVIPWDDIWQPSRR